MNRTSQRPYKIKSHGGGQGKTLSNPVHRSPDQKHLLDKFRRGVEYGKLSPCHPWTKISWVWNWRISVFGLFGLQSWLTSSHVFGHVARPTCLLRVPCDRPGVVDDFRQWKFSICYKNIGVMFLLVKGYKCRICKNIGLPTKYFFFWILQLHPSTKRAITPMFK